MSSYVTLTDHPNRELSQSGFKLKHRSGIFRVKTCVIQSKSLKTVTLLAIAAGVIPSCEAKIIQRGAPSDLAPT